MSTILSNYDIFQIGDREAVEVEVPEWGQTIRLATLSAQQAAEFNAKQITFNADGTRKVNNEAIYGRPYLLVAACAVDADGKRLFTDKEAGAKSVRVINRLYEIAAALNGFNETAIEDAEKN